MSAAAVQVEQGRSVAPWALVAAVVAGVVAALVLDEHTLPWDGLLFGGWLIVTACVGAVLAARVRGNPIGWLLLACALGLSVQGAAVEYARSGGPAAAAAGWISHWISIPSFACFGVALLLFPTGRTPSRRWRWVLPLLLGSVAVITVTTAFIPGPMGAAGENPLGWRAGGDVLRMVADVTTFPLVVAAVAMVVSVVVRARRSTGTERQQLRWFGAGVVVALLGAVFAAVSPQATNELSFVAVMIGFLAIPVAIGVAILEYHLYDLDRVINRALVDGALTVLIGGTYVGVVAGLGAISQQAMGLVASVVAAVLVAVLALPARARLQAAADRLVHGDRGDPHRAMVALARRLESVVEPEQVPDLVVAAVRSSLKVPYVALEDAAGRSLAASGTPTERLDTVPVVWDGTVLARIVVGGERRPARPYAAALTDLASQLAPALHGLQLTDDLRRSRERIVVAREEERRRLRADLHDGLGPRLAGLSLGLDAVDNLLDADPTAAREAVASLRARSREAVAVVREVVEGLRPPALDDLGLLGAVRARTGDLAAAAGCQLTIEAEAPLPALPAAVEVAAHHIAVEAVTNAAKHARAERIDVRFTASDTALLVTVSDDGRGLPSASGRGFGMTSMRERAAELGGSLTVTTADGRGTTVVAELPVARR